MDLKEAENKEKLARIYGRTIQKVLRDWDNHDGVITHLGTDILASKVK